MLKVKEVIVVEGRYDKNTLSQVVDATILETSGFQVFRDKETVELLHRAAESRGLIVFTDADGAGLVIRNYLKKVIPSQYLKHAYIPEIAGKERRKSIPGKEGLLGVEGMCPEVIVEALRRAGATIDDEQWISRGHITKQDLVELGLSGGANSSGKRKRLLVSLGLPTHMSANAMLQALNILYTYSEFTDMVKALENDHD